MEKIIFDLNELISSLSALSTEKKPKFIKSIKAHFKVFKCNVNLRKRIKAMDSYSVSDLGQLASMILNYRVNHRYFTGKETANLDITVNPFMFEGKPKISIQIRAKDKSPIKLVSIKSSYDNKTIDVFMDIEERYPGGDTKINRYRIYNGTISKSSKNINEVIAANYFDIALITSIDEILEDIEEVYHSETNKNDK